MRLSKPPYRAAVHLPVVPEAVQTPPESDWLHSVPAERAVAPDVGRTEPYKTPRTEPGTEGSPQSTALLSPSTDVRTWDHSTAKR